MSASAQELALGEQRETWCAVERMKEEDWCRKQRGHIARYKEEMDSDVFGQNEISKPEIKPRCEFAPNRPTHKQQRHFPKIDNRSQLNL